MRRWILVAALGGSVGLVACAEVEYPPTAEGRYMANCSRCHEADGSSTVASKQADDSIDLRNPFFQRNVSDADIARIIRRGKGQMMAVTGLSAAEVDSIILHVRTLVGIAASGLDTDQRAD